MVYCGNSRDALDEWQGRYVCCFDCCIAVGGSEKKEFENKKKIKENADERIKLNKIKFNCNCIIIIHRPLVEATTHVCYYYLSFFSALPPSNILPNNKAASLPMRLQRPQFDSQLRKEAAKRGLEEA